MPKVWTRALGRAHVAALAALVALAGGCSSSSPSAPGERLVYADGRSLHLARFDGAQVVEVDSASIPADGLLDGHAIFGIMKHPAKPILYVSSFNECWSTGEWCWGNARIDRFRVSKSSIAYDGLAFAYDATATLAACASLDWGYEGQVGACAPVNGVFSADGTRLYMKEDDDDVLEVFEVGSDGSLTMLWEGDSIDLHGMALHPTEPYVYNGSNVVELVEDEGSTISYGSGGNYTTFLTPAAGDPLLLTTLSTDSVGVFSLADPAAPAEVDSLYLGSDRARAVVVNEAQDRIVVAGRNQVATVAFDGATLSLEDTVDLSGGAHVENRSVALIEGGSHAAVSWFQRSDANPSGWIGGVTVYAIADDGTLSSVDTQLVDRASRVVQSMILR